MLFWITQNPWGELKTPCAEIQPSTIIWLWYQWKKWLWILPFSWPSLLIQVCRLTDKNTLCTYFLLWIVLRIDISVEWAVGKLCLFMNYCCTAKESICTTKNVQLYICLYTLQAYFFIHIFSSANDWAQCIDCLFIFPLLGLLGIVCEPDV